jgi:small-conductance mechanosensitive channel
MLAMPYCTVEDYWDVYWGLIGEIKTKLSAAGYEAPFPQLVYNQKN